LVNRLERAYAFEVRTALPEKPTPEQEACGATVRAFTTVTFQQIGTPLLSLPEAESDAEEQKTKKAKGAKSKR